ncbi:septum formation initiator family protein [Rubritalea sp.]|uniref:septum formation initiator family protein n=1 Tax=Rubritalea sp. TaxID=2109375 RepID=UPI003EF9B9F2
MLARTRFLQRLNVVAFYSLLIIACGGVIAKCLPEFRKLQSSEDELALIQVSEAAVNARYDQQLREYRALEQDPDFLEIYGRDRLDLYKDGERVFRFSRERMP